MKVEQQPIQLINLLHWLRLLALIVAIFPALAQAQSTSSNDAANTSGNETTNEVVDQSITVVEGDTYQSLSMKFFKTIGLWRHIAEYNQLDPARPLIVGQTLQIPSIVSRPREFAQVVYSHGDATYFSKETGEEEPVSNSIKVYVGDAIKTDRSGFVSVEFRTGTVINLQPRTHVQLISLNCLESDALCFIEINADGGSFDATVESQQQKTDMRIKTPTASAAVRGTTFDFDSSGGNTSIGVTTGQVDLIAGTASVALDRGFGLKAVPNEPLGQPIALLPPLTYTNIPPRVTQEDKLSVWALQDASGYEWSITSDPIGRQVLNRSRSTQTSFQIPSLAAGGYYATARGIDDDGLKGFSTSQKINIAVIVDRAPVELDSEFENNLLLLSVRDPEDSVGYEVQLAENASFIDAVSVDIGSSGLARFASQKRPVFVRARMLITPGEVSSYGPAITIE